MLRKFIIEITINFIQKLLKRIINSVKILRKFIKKNLQIAINN